MKIRNLLYAGFKFSSFFKHNQTTFINLNSTQIYASLSNQLVKVGLKTVKDWLIKVKV